jgi:hypothetical protein
LVSKLLGHTNIETTSRYAHVLTSDLRDALDAFSVMGKEVQTIGVQSKSQIFLA